MCTVLAAVFAVVLLVYALLVVLVRQVGGTLRSTSGHAGQLLAWTITTLQGVAQVAAVTSSSLPSLLTRMFNSVRVLVESAQLLNFVALNRCSFIPGRRAEFSRSCPSASVLGGVPF